MRFIIGLLVIIGLIVLILVLILSGGGKSPQRPGMALHNYYDTGAVVKLTINGAVEAPSTHREIEVTVGRDQSNLSVIQGYNGRVIKSKTYANDQNSYQEFLSALEKANFTKGTSSPNNGQDERGFCPLGERFNFELVNGSQTIVNHWTSNCGAGTGNFKGAAGLIVQLFQNQIPDYNTLTSNVNLMS